MLEIVRKDYHTIYVTYSYDIYHVRMFEYERACSFSYVCLIFFYLFFFLSECLYFGEDLFTCLTLIVKESEKLNE